MSAAIIAAFYFTSDDKEYGIWSQVANAAANKDVKYTSVCLSKDGLVHAISKDGKLFTETKEVLTASTAAFATEADTLPLMQCTVDTTTDTIWALTTTGKYY